ncbi:MAG: hypothetical protein IT429_06460 [Gemmataceae bacterium]|nr:hypothetical protein [Gemmataceae bacterium]
MDHKVACPQCAAPLRSNKPIPAGVKVKCPRCGLQFSTPHANGVGAPHGSGIGAVVAAGAAIQAVLPPHTAPAATATAAGLPLAPSAAVETPATAPTGTGKRALVLGGSAVALLAVTGVVVLLCFSGGTEEPPPPEAKQPAAKANWNLPPLVVNKKVAGPPPLIVLPPEQQKKVEASVQRGVAFLTSRQLATGAWPGTGGKQVNALGVTCLAGLALLECGLKPADPPIAKAAKYVRDKAPGFSSAHEVYELSLSILFLDKLGDPADKPLIQEMALRLVAAQTPRGGWSYRAPALTKQEYKQLYTLLKDLKTTNAYAMLERYGGYDVISPKLHNLPVLQADLDKTPPAKGKPRKGPKGARVKGGPGAPGDNSNTQFAILAIWAARKHDVPLDKTLALVNRRFRTTQNADGSWSYRPGAPAGARPTMTAAGLLGLAIGFGVDDHKGRPDDDALVKRGLASLSRSIGEPGGAKAPAQKFLYLMWSIERVGVLYQLKTINGKRWYEWGVEMLTANQHADGHWRSNGIGASSDVVDTSFALLFLQRANLAADLTDKLMQLAAAPGAAAAPPAQKE